jgi:hypothetical protein
MKTKIMGVITVALVLAFAGMSEATIVEISSSTNKPVYELGEEVVVFVIAYNPNPEPLTLFFGSTLQASYLMDGVFDWTEKKRFEAVLTKQIIEPDHSYTWNLIHDSFETSIYPLGVGTHILVGYVVGYGDSAPLEFEVVPEPAMILLLGLGSLMVKKRR